LAGAGDVQLGFIAASWAVLGGVAFGGPIILGAVGLLAAEAVGQTCRAVSRIPLPKREPKLSLTYTPPPPPEPKEPPPHNRGTSGRGREAERSPPAGRSDHPRCYSLIAELRSWMGDNVDTLLRVEVLEDMDKVLPRPGIEVSTDENWWKREKENREHRGAKMLAFANNRGKDTFIEFPGINNMAPFGLACYQDLDCWKKGEFVAESVLTEALEPGNDTWAYVLQHMQTPNLKAKLQRQSVYVAHRPNDPRVRHRPA
jgi:hypothetical protein